MSSSVESSKVDDLDVNENKKKENENKRVVRNPNNDIQTYIEENGIRYNLNDSVYYFTGFDVPYAIGTIKEIKNSKKDNAIVSVKSFYRRGELPDAVYQMLNKDRLKVAETAEDRELVLRKECRLRELFLCKDEDSTPVSFPVAKLRGRCSVNYLKDFNEVKNFSFDEDQFFYILGFNPDIRKLSNIEDFCENTSFKWTATERGCLQKANIPDLVQQSALDHYKDRDFEEVCWKPGKVLDSELLEYIRSCRAIVLFVGMCDANSSSEGYHLSSRDATLIHSIQILSNGGYDVRRAINAFIKDPLPPTIDRKWSEEQVKRFAKGVQKTNKDFFKLRKDHLSIKTRAELVEFYYAWKKAPDSLMIQPQSKVRRQATMKRVTKTETESSTEIDSESDNEISFNCQTCNISILRSDSSIAKFCEKCQIVFNKYGDDRYIEIDFDAEPDYEFDMRSTLSPSFGQSLPHFLFKPIKERFFEQSSSVGDENHLKNESEKKSFKRQWTEDDDETKNKRLKSAEGLDQEQKEPLNANWDRQTNFTRNLFNQRLENSKNEVKDPEETPNKNDEDPKTDPKITDNQTPQQSHDDQERHIRSLSKIREESNQQTSSSNPSRSNSLTIESKLKEFCEENEEIVPSPQPYHHATLKPGEKLPPEFRWFQQPTSSCQLRLEKVYSSANITFLAKSGSCCSRTDFVWKPSKQEQMKPARSYHHSNQQQHHHRDSKTEEQSQRSLSFTETRDSKREIFRPVAVPHPSSTSAKSFDLQRSSHSRSSPYNSRIDNPASRTLRHYAGIGSSRDHFSAFDSMQSDLREHLSKSSSSVLPPTSSSSVLDHKLLEHPMSSVMEQQIQAAIRANLHPSLVTPSVEQLRQPFAGLIPGMNSHPLSNFGPILPSHHDLHNLHNLERMSSESRLNPERLAMEQQLRMELLHGHHQHAHIHSHLHLHQPNLSNPGTSAPPTAPGILNFPSPPDPTSLGTYSMIQHLQAQQAFAGMDPVHAAMMANPLFNLGGARPPAAGLLPPHPPHATRGVSGLDPGAFMTATHQLQAAAQAQEQSLIEQRAIHEEYLRLTASGHK